MRLHIRTLLLMCQPLILLSSAATKKPNDKDFEAPKKVVGANSVTSVSVVMNGDHPQLADAVGRPVPKPSSPLPVASPINLLNPDRYEFYTFDDNGQLIKRLMTLEEIQSIVANGDGEIGPPPHGLPNNDRDPQKNIQDIVNNVQNVLNKEVEVKKNISAEPTILDTPDVSSSWSMILPAIFGNTGDTIYPPKPQQVMTPETEIFESSPYVVSTEIYKSSTKVPKLPPRRRPSSTKRPFVSTTKKIFVNNQEVVRPIINRIDATSGKPFSKPYSTSVVTRRVVSSTTTTTSKASPSISTTLATPVKTETTKTIKENISTTAASIPLKKEPQKYADFNLVENGAYIPVRIETVPENQQKNNFDSNATNTIRPSQDDAEAKHSFDQIMESLKVTRTRGTPDMTTQTPSSTKFTVEQGDSYSHNNSNTVKFEPLFADLREPITQEIPTETTISETTMPVIKNDIDKPEVKTYNEDYSFIDDYNFNEDTTSVTIKSKEEVEDVKKTPSLQNENKIIHKIDQLIAENLKTSTEGISFEKVQNIPMPNLLTNTTMNDFVRQAATIGSTMIEDISTESSIEDENSEEIKTLLTDVLNQITGSSSITPPFDKKAEVKMEKDEDMNKNISNQIFNISEIELYPTIIPNNSIEDETEIQLSHEKEIFTADDDSNNQSSEVFEKIVDISTKTPEYIKIETTSENNYTSDELSSSVANDQNFSIESKESEENLSSLEDEIDLTTINTILIEAITTILPANNNNLNESSSAESIENSSENIFSRIASAEIESTETLKQESLINSTENQDTITVIPQIQQQTTEIEQAFVKLGELTTTTTTAPLSEPITSNPSIVQNTVQTSSNQILNTNKTHKIRPSTLKPIHYFRQPGLNDQKYIQFNNQRPVYRPASLTNLKIGQVGYPTRIPVILDPVPDETLGLAISTQQLKDDVKEFAKLCNELAFSYWKSITSEKISPARSLVISPFALTSTLSMIFLGARGGTSGEMNEILRLDDMVTFNPHLIFKNITESVQNAKDSNVIATAFVREVYTDRTNGKLLQFFKEKVQQLYGGNIEEVNFNFVNDIIRRRTNLLVKKQTYGKILEYLRTNTVWVNGPLATVSANLFQSDCSSGSNYDRDGEMFFQVHPSIRQRRLVPIPAVVWRSGFTAGYDPDLDATAVAFGLPSDTISTIYLMPGQQGISAPGDSLERLEQTIVHTGATRNSWTRLLTKLMDRPGLEVQLPRFSHRSFINASAGLQKMGLKALFNSNNADLRGLTGSSNRDMYLADMIQINTFSTCAEDKISDRHHVEMYPAPPIRRGNSMIDEEYLDLTAAESNDYSTNMQYNGRAFDDDLLYPKYLELPLPLRPRQARIPEAPRLRFDRPFLFFARHNPTGILLFMGRFNPRLLP